MDIGPEQPLRTLALFLWVWGICSLFFTNYKFSSITRAPKKKIPPPLPISGVRLSWISLKKCFVFINVFGGVGRDTRTTCGEIKTVQQLKGVQHWVLAWGWAFLEFCIWSRRGSGPSIADPSLLWAPTTGTSQIIPARHLLSLWAVRHLAVVCYSILALFAFTIFLVCVCKLDGFWSCSPQRLALKKGKFTFKTINATLSFFSCLELRPSVPLFLSAETSTPRSVPGICILYLSCTAVECNGHWHWFNKCMYTQGQMQLHALTSNHQKRGSC